MMSKWARWWVAAGAATMALALPAARAFAAPSALVEDVQGQVAGIEFMDYVAPGRVIALGANGRIVLGYLKSCWRETIAGGTVTVGEAQSTVRDGQVQRTRVACDGARAAPAAREATQSAATVFRSLRSDSPPVTVYGLSPLVEVGARRGALRIERLDPAGEPIQVTIEPPALVAGRFVDLAAARVSLVAESTYALRLDGRSIVFRVDRDAQSGASAAAGRLLRFD